MNDDMEELKSFEQKILDHELARHEMDKDITDDRVDEDYMAIFIEKYGDIFEIDYSEGIYTPYETIKDHIIIYFAGEVVYEATGPNRKIYDYKLRKSDLENFVSDIDYETLSKIFLF